MILFVGIGVFAMIILFLYTFLICRYCYFWEKEPEFFVEEKKNSTKFSIIIPVRNEELTILECLRSIINQDYPKELFEILLVDDNSTDKTASLVNEFISLNNNYTICLLALKDELFKGLFKKRAISKAMNVASGNLIITTDADCVMGKKWLQSIASFYEKTNVDMIIGPVAFHRENSTFEKLQSLEFMALIGSGGAAAMAKNPIMCNGANLIYKKEIFEKVGGYDDDDMHASGDDVFLMLKIKRDSLEKISFLKSHEAMVYTEAKHNIGSFFNQRKRWISKSKNYKDAGLIYVAVIVYLSNFTVLLCCVLGFIEIRYLWISAMVFGLKTIVDFIFLKQIATFFQKEKLLCYFLPEQVGYLFYVTLMGVLGNIGKYKWKGRLQR